MPADTDHLRRDALHAARSEVRILAGKYIRRFDASAKAHIDSVLANSEGEIDGTEIGREAARLAIAEYLGDPEPREAVDAAAAAELDPPGS